MQDNTNTNFLSLEQDQLDAVSGGMDMSGGRLSENVEDCRTGTCYQNGVPIATQFFDGYFWRDSYTITSGDFARFDREYSGNPDIADPFPNAIDFNLIASGGSDLTGGGQAFGGIDTFSASGGFDLFEGGGGGGGGGGGVYLFYCE